MPALEIEPLFREALRLHQQGSTTRAGAIYEKILKSHPAHFDSCHLLGVVHMQAGSPERAVDLISRALTISPHSADAHFNLSHAFRSLGRANEALASVDRAISIRPDFAGYHFERGIMLQKMGRLTEALASFGEASRLDPAFPDACRRKAAVLLKLDRLEEALASCDAAIRLAPRAAKAYALKGRVLIRLERLEEALASYDAAIALDPKHAETHHQRGRLLGALKRLDDAVTSYGMAIESDPDRLDSYLPRAAALNELWRFEEALACCDRLISLEPDFAEVYLQRGYALGRLNRMNEALASFEKAMSFKKIDGLARLGRAGLHSRRERWDLAQQDYEELLRQDPDNESVWTGLSWLPVGYVTAECASDILERQNRLPEGPSPAPRLFLKGRLLRHLKRHDESFACIQQGNALRLAELARPNEWRSHYTGSLQTAHSWQPKQIRRGSSNSGCGLLVVLGPSSSGKTTLERLLCADVAFKRGYEGGSARIATGKLRKISDAVSTSNPLTAEEVSQRQFEALFPTRAEEMLEGRHAVVTITNPHLLEAAHLIYDLYAGSRFVFLERGAIDTAAEIFTKGYRVEYPFGYCPNSALDYVELYRRISAVLCTKMGSRALTVSYEDLIASPGSILTDVYGMLGLDPPRDGVPAGEARDPRSVYREYFAALCSKQGIVWES